MLRWKEAVVCVLVMVSQLGAVDPELRKHSGKMWKLKVIPDVVGQELVLTKAGGPYWLKKPVKVPAFSSLKIERGTLVIASPGASLTAYGEMRTFGEAKEYVKFRPEVPAAGWDKIEIQAGWPQNLEYFDVRGANCGLVVGESVQATVKQCIFSRNRQGVDVKRTKPSYTLFFDHCLVTENIGDGFTLYLCNVKLAHCTINENGGVGVNLTYYGNLEMFRCDLIANAVGLQSKLYETRVKVYASNIVGNRLTASVQTEQDFDCCGNFWGVTSEEAITSMIVDGRKKPKCGIVTCRDVEYRQVADAGCGFKLLKDKPNLWISSK